MRMLDMTSVTLPDANRLLVRGNKATPTKAPSPRAGAATR